MLELAWAVVCGGPLPLPLPCPLAFACMHAPARWWRLPTAVRAGFVFPGKVSRYLNDQGIIEDKDTANMVSQLAVPVVAQLGLTPMHLLALDFYNNPKFSLAERAALIRRIYLESLITRMVRWAEGGGGGGGASGGCLCEMVWAWLRDAVSRCPVRGVRAHRACLPQAPVSHVCMCGCVVALFVIQGRVFGIYSIAGVVNTKFRTSLKVRPPPPPPTEPTA
jgi:hypothetical protein